MTIFEKHTFTLAMKDFILSGSVQKRHYKVKSIE